MAHRQEVDSGVLLHEAGWFPKLHVGGLMYDMEGKHAKHAGLGARPITLGWNSQS